MALVTRRNRPASATSAAATCGSSCASDTTIPFRARRRALATFCGVIRLVAPRDSWPTGAHLPQVLNSVRQRSYCARSAAVSAGAAGAGAGAWPATATVRTEHTATKITARRITPPGLFPSCGALRKQGRPDAPPGRLLERVGERDQPRLAAGAAGEADAERRRPRVKAGWKRGHRRVRHHRERHDHSGIAGPRRDGGAARARKQQRVK